MSGKTIDYKRFNDESLSIVTQENNINDMMSKD